MASNSIIKTLNVAVLPCPAWLGQIVRHAVYGGQSDESLTYEIRAVIRSTGNGQPVKVITKYSKRVMCGPETP